MDPERLVNNKRCMDRVVVSSCFTSTDQRGSKPYGLGDGSSLKTANSVFPGLLLPSHLLHRAIGALNEPSDKRRAFSSRLTPLAAPDGVKGTGLV